ncbi:regulatory protein MarR [Syntrophobotulus glycolicus DSM 8271]|uniref:Regulatory protein MarR n=1 Tax=Syntrophobotulus glycolicus (strain DSM 8271 / FlGlyR) TaxID=645991 RepID=F0SWF5_SYNGF|nr:MarR family transcriptional regulator [Syntrophobotulus glycolicus]ADY55721.1 regulatory protein MarR [Syntrophobotulus glycolicus DSM 8271]
MGKDKNNQSSVWNTIVNNDEVVNIHLLFNISHMSTLILKKRKELLATFELEPWSYDMLVILYQAGESGLSPKELLKRTGVASGTMTHRINLLLKSEFIISTPAPDDGRSIIATISDKGKSVVKKAIKAHADESAKILGDLNKEELAAFQQITQKLIHQLQ